MFRGMPEIELGPGDYRRRKGTRRQANAPKEPILSPGWHLTLISIIITMTILGAYGWFLSQFPLWISLALSLGITAVFLLIAALLDRRRAGRGPRA